MIVFALFLFQKPKDIDNITFLLFKNYLFDMKNISKNFYSQILKILKLYIEVDKIF